MTRMNINVQCNNVKDSSEKRMQTKDNAQCVIEEENQIIRQKNFSAAFQVGNDPLVNKLNYKNTQKPSKPKLSNVLEPSKLQLSRDFTKSCLY